MKKFKLIIPIVLLCVAICTIAAYFIYGSTLIDITSDKSINDHFAIDPENPITILKTKKIGNYFGIIYTDPLDKEYDYSFKYITKSPLYKNRYYNVGGYSNFLGSGTLGFTEVKSPNEKENRADVFIYYLGNNKYKYKKCSVYAYNLSDNEINFEEISDDKEIIEKFKRMADSVKKVDEIELPDDNVFIVSKTYNLDYPYEMMSFYDGSISEEDIKQNIINEADASIAEYHEYMKGKNNE